MRASQLWSQKILCSTLTVCGITLLIPGFIIHCSPCITEMLYHRTSARALLTSTCCTTTYTCSITASFTTSHLHSSSSLPNFTSHSNFPPSLPTSSLSTLTPHPVYPPSLPTLTPHLHFFPIFLSLPAFNKRRFLHSVVPMCLQSSTDD